MAVLTVIAFVLGGVSVFLLGVIAWRRVVLLRRELRNLELERRLRPAVLGFIGSGEELPAGLSAPEQELLADMLGHYAQVLRGPARDRIVAYFQRQGVVERELRELARSRHGWRRAFAAHRLGDIGPPETADALMAALADPDQDVRTAAARSLGRLGQPEAAGSLLAALASARVPRLLARWSLLQLGPPAAPRLRDLAGSPEAGERAGAVQLLGLLGTAADAELLEGRLRDSSALVRQQAAAGLGRLGSAHSVPGLMALLEDRVPGVRAAAATALGRLRDPRAAGPLLAHARGDLFDVARIAAHALAETDPQLARREAPHGHQLAEAADQAALALT